MENTIFLPNNLNVLKPIGNVFKTWSFSCFDHCGIKVIIPLKMMLCGNIASSWVCMVASSCRIMPNKHSRCKCPRGAIMCALMLSFEAIMTWTLLHTGQYVLPLHLRGISASHFVIPLLSTVEDVHGRMNLNSGYNLLLGQDHLCYRSLYKSPWSLTSLTKWSFLL